MQTFIFIFGNNIQERQFKTTYEAMCEYLDADHQYEDVFYAKNAKGVVVNLLEAESLVKSIHPVKEYLEIAALAGFGKEQILQETKALCGVANDALPAPWTQFMEEFIEGYHKYLKEKSSRYGLVTWPESQDFVGRPDCVLVIPPQYDSKLSLDSAYLVPESVTGPLDAGEAYVRVPFPDAQKWDGKAARGFADILHGYDSRDAYVLERVIHSEN